MSKDTLHFAVLAVDTVALRLNNNVLEVALIKANSPDFLGKDALPGGLVHPEETAGEASMRVLAEKAELKKLYTEQLYTFSEVERDPRGRVVSVAYLAFVSPEEKSDTSLVQWVPVHKAPRLAYDHNHILAVALERLRARIRYTTLVQHLLPKEFTFTMLQEAYESILGQTLDKRNFRRKVLAGGSVLETAHMVSGGQSRPALLYRFAHKEVELVEMV